MFIFILGLNEKVNAVENTEDYAFEQDSQGIIMKGTEFKADKSVFRPVYQGDYSIVLWSYPYLE